MNEDNVTLGWVERLGLGRRVLKERVGREDCIYDVEYLTVASRESGQSWSGPPRGSGSQSYGLRRRRTYRSRSGIESQGMAKVLQTGRGRQPECGRGGRLKDAKDTRGLRTEG